MVRIRPNHGMASLPGRTAGDRGVPDTGAAAGAVGDGELGPRAASGVHYYAQDIRYAPLPANCVRWGGVRRRGCPADDGWPGLGSRAAEERAPGV